METINSQLESKHAMNLTVPAAASAGTSSSVDDWFLMESPWPVVTIAAVYLVFVLVVGPRFMRNKTPFDLRMPIAAYNGAMVAFSSWWLFKTFTDSTMLENFVGSACAPISNNINPTIIRHFDTMAWYYLMSKYVELLDTVFFVLRRKDNQVTFLHVYHHSNMAVSAWASVKYIRGSQTLVIATVNSFVHVIMYAYYFLSALGPKFQKYLWWKRYITRLQISQFLFVICYMSMLIWWGCQVHRTFFIFSIFNTLSFLLLFADFYKKAYLKNLNKKD